MRAGDDWRSCSPLPSDFQSGPVRSGPVRVLTRAVEVLVKGTEIWYRRALTNHNNPPSCVQRLFLPAGHALCPCLFVCWFVHLHLYHVYNNCITLLPCDFTLADLITAWSTGIATKSSLAQLQVWNIEEQRQCRRNDKRLTESGNTRNEQLLVMPTEQLTNWECLPGEPLNGSECNSKAWLVF